MRQVILTAEPFVEAATAPAVGPGERERALAVITLGFATDPIARWVWPDAAGYLRWMPRFNAAFSGAALDAGTADLTGCGRAAAFWLPPGIHSDSDALEALFAESIPARRRGEVDAFVGQMEKFHPDEPCWHLTQIAAEVEARGQGLGSTLLAAGLRRCDAEGAAAYLESSNPMNLPLYRRFGFEMVGEIQAGSSPVMHPMLRRPR